MTFSLRMKKRVIVVISLLFILLCATTVMAAEGSISDRIIDVFQKVILTFAKIFTFEKWFGNEEIVFIGFLRFCVWAVTFAVFYYALHTANMGRAGGAIAPLSESATFNWHEYNDLKPHS